MADTAKQLVINGGTLISDLRSLFTVIKTRRTVAFAYGFVFAFIGFSVLLAFNPSSSTYSPWLTNIFSSSNSSGSSLKAGSYRSQFPFVFSNIFSNSSSEGRNQSSPPPPPSQSPISGNSPSGFENSTGVVADYDETEASKAKHSTEFSLPSPSSVHRSRDSSVSLLKAPSKSMAENHTFGGENGEKSEVSRTNQTLSSNPTVPAPSNQTVNYSTDLTSSVKINPEEEKKRVDQKTETSNYTVSQSSKQDPGKSSQANTTDDYESLMNCDFFHGEWVRDDSYPLYKPGSCSLIDEQFNCIINGRPDKYYQTLKWKPKNCNLPRLDGSRMLELLRGKRLVFVGDSLNRNMWESLVCILKNSSKDQSKVFEAHGRSHFRGEASYSFIFKDYNLSVEFFVSPFLVREWEMPDKKGSKKETLRLDLVGKCSDEYKAADVLVFNTGHWWTHDKTAKGKDYYQEGSHVYDELNVIEAFRKALTTWARWVDANVNPMKSTVFFRGYSHSHFSGGQWNSGGQCDSETEPIKNETYLRPYPPKMTVLEKVLQDMKTKVTYLNITRMTDIRKDGHPSIYRKQRLSDEERKTPLSFQDCSHWCLPGVPDAWNEILYAQLLVKQQQQQQKRKKKKKQ